MPVSWKDYLALRKITAEQYINSRGIKDYSAFVKSFNKRDVVPPDVSEVSAFFASQEPAVETKPTSEKATSTPKKAETPKEKKLEKSSARGEDSAKVDISQRKPRNTRRRTRKSSPKSKT